MVVPDSTEALTVRSLLDAEATRLFLDRARLREPDFEIPDRDSAVVVRICRRLDGMPLAIELATACLAALSLEQIEARLADRFNLLTADAWAVEPRQRTLAAVFDWSYDLLTDDERRLFARLSVFAGGCTLEAAEEVCSGVGLEAGVLRPLRRLVDASLVGVERTEGGPRYIMLETVREYARARLREAGGESDTTARHLAWWLRLVEVALPELFRPQQGVWLARLDAERDNLHAALDTAAASPTRRESRRPDASTSKRRSRFHTAPTPRATCRRRSTSLARSKSGSETSTAPRSCNFAASTSRERRAIVSASRSRTSISD
jgi:predicted ATPase